MPSRILREGILTSERVNQLSWEAEVFYRRLMSVVDDFGRFTAHPSLLRAALYPLKLDSVRDANMERLLATVEQARLVRVYEIAGKRYLELLDFRQQVRAKESKYPPPPEDDQPLLSTCLADAQQMSSTCLASAHVDGGGDVDEVVDVIPTNHTARDTSDDDDAPPPTTGEPFRMTAAWKPSDHITTLIRQAGLATPSTNELNGVICEFVSYWLTQAMTRTQHEWDHAFVKNLKAGSMERFKAPVQPTRRQPKSENFANRDYGTGGRL